MLRGSKRKALGFDQKHLIENIDPTGNWEACSLFYLFFLFVFIYGCVFYFLLEILLAIHTWNFSDAHYAASEAHADAADSHF